MSAAIKLQYLVVGTGRSGTVYVAKLLTAVGLPCSHEQIFNGRDLEDVVRVLECGGKNSACSTHFGLDFAGPPVAESSYMAVPFLEHELLMPSTLIHVARDPLKVIRSFLNNLLFFREDRVDYCHAQEQFIRAHLPHLNLLPDPASRACYYYLRWNQMIEESAGGRKYFLYPIESGPQPVLDFLGRTPGSSALPDATCNAYNKWPEHMRVACDLPPIRDDEIQSCFLWKEVATLAARYGYSYPTRIPRRPGPPRGGRLPSQTARPQPAKPSCYPVQPRMVEANYHGFNIVQHRESFVAAHQELGPLDLSQLSLEERNRLRAGGRLLIEDSLQRLKTRALESRVEALRRILATYFTRRHDNEFALLPHLVEANHRNYDLYCYLDRCFAVSRELTSFDFERLSSAEFQFLKEGAFLLEESSVERLKAKVRALGRPDPSVVAGEQARQGFNLLRHEGKVYALARAVEPQDVGQLDPATLHDLEATGKCFAGESVEGVWALLSRALASSPELLEVGYHGFNLVAYRGKVFAAEQRVGPLDLTRLEASDLARHRAAENIFVAASAQEARHWIDALARASARAELEEKGGSGRKRSGPPGPAAAAARRS